MTTLVWFRDDLRVVDHPALRAAGESGDGVVALFVLDQHSAHARPPGGAALWWLHHSLVSLTRALAGLGIPLVLRRTKPRHTVEEVVTEVAAECGADSVFWNRRYGEARHHDAALKTSLPENGTTVRSFAGDVLFEPWTIATQEGRAYRVYSAFWRACTAAPAPPDPVAAPARVSGAAVAVCSAAIASVSGDDLDSWGLLPKNPDWSAGLAERWKPGEDAATDALDAFLARGGAAYARRDFPAEEVGSELSPHLRWGEISPRTVWKRAIDSREDVGLFLSELGWREFAKHTAFHFGPLHETNLNGRFDAFPWRTDGDEEFEAWHTGRTGFGIVDAGMRELWQTGFMHNRVRMITASFLTKNLLLDWRLGEAWFWDTLVDADEASNPFNWQWVAGSGADAAPYFRVFNPELQQRKFDPEGLYTTRWAADSSMTPPIVDVKFTRNRALDAYRGLPG